MSKENLERIIDDIEANFTEEELKEHGNMFTEALKPYVTQAISELQALQQIIEDGEFEPTRPDLYTDIQRMVVAEHARQMATDFLLQKLN